jgi:hypothetical protein
MTNEYQPVGLDNGNALTKLVAGLNQELVYPSAVAHMKKAVKVGTHTLKPSYKDDTGEYLVGQDAIDHGETIFPALDSMRYLSDEYRVTGMHALYKAGISKAYVVCGLPVGHFVKFREQVQRTVMGWAAHDDRIKIPRVEVLHEPAGTYFDKILGWNGQVMNDFSDEDIGIVDFGGHTLDISVVRKGKAVLSDHVCRGTGAIHAYQPLLHELTDAYKGAPFTLYDMPKVVETGQIVLDGKVVSVAKLAQQARQSMVKSVKQGIHEMWPKGTRLLRCILLTGGPANLLLADLKKEFANIEVPQNPHMANARGFFKFAMGRCNPT